MKKRRSQPAGLSPEELRRVLIIKGELIPETEDEVRLFEESVDIDHVTLPDGLSDPFAVLARDDADQEAKLIPFPKVSPNKDVGEQLARAARDGKPIPPEVEERMRQDREAAEEEEDEDGQQ